MQVIFDHKKDEVNNIKTFYFKAPEGWRYTAGQFIELYLPHEDEDDRGHKRWFTLSSSPTDDFLSITTRIFEEGASSFKRTLDALEPGTEVRMADPMGDFVLPQLVQTPLVFVAGGIGITPFHSMLQYIAATGEERHIKMIYGVNNEDDILFTPTFEAAKQHVTIVVSNPTPAWGGERGQMTAEMILGLSEITDDTLVYLSGPEPMIEKLTNDLIATGVDKRQVVTDYFPGYDQI